MFVYLIYETAKLSREKIRHQFAIDSAAFIEMSNYSDFLNRSAYVNGAFPMRIFKEAFGPATQIQLRCYDSPCPSADSLMTLMFMNGDFPMDTQDSDWMSAGGEQAYTAKAKWEIRFCDSSSNPPCFIGNKGTTDGEPADGDGMNVVPPPTRQCDSTLLKQQGVSPGGSCHEIFNYGTAQDYASPIQYTCVAPYSGSDSSNLCLQPGQTIIDIWAKVYTLLGQVEGAQFGVLGRLAADHHFLKKSYWLNTSGQGPDGADAQTASNSFNASGASGFQSAVSFDCLDTVTGFARTAHGRGGCQPAKAPFLGTMQPAPMCIINPPIPLSGTDSCPEAGGGMGSGLFQVASLDPGMVTPDGGGGSMQRGWIAATTWHIVDPKTDGAVDWGSGAENFFGVPFQAPAVCAKATLGESPDPYASVWPDPTPKFQTRLRPCDVLPIAL